MQEAIVTAGRRNGCLKRRIAAWAKNVGLRSNMAAMEGSVVAASATHWPEMDYVAVTVTRMWANAQPDGRPAEHRWRPLFNAAKFG